MLKRLQTAYYVEGRPIAEREELIRIAVELGLDAEAFPNAYDQATRALRADASVPRGRRRVRLSDPGNRAEREAHQAAFGAVLWQAGAVPQDARRLPGARIAPGVAARLGALLLGRGGSELRRTSHRIVTLDDLAHEADTALTRAVPRMLMDCGPQGVQQRLAMGRDHCLHANKW